MKTKFETLMGLIVLLLIFVSCNTQTFEHYKAKAGNAKAQYNLGRCYFEGEGITMDKAKAVEW